MAIDTIATASAVVTSPDWVSILAKYWLRLQIGVAVAAAGTLEAALVGVDAFPKQIPLVAIAHSYPAQTTGLILLLVVLTGLAFVVSREPRRRAGNAPILGVASQPAQLVPSTSDATPALDASPIAAGKTDVPARAGGSKKAQLAMVSTLVLMLVSLAVMGTGVVLVAHAGSQLQQDPLTRFQAFCTDLKHQNYPNAYQLLSADAQTQTSPMDFKNARTLQDRIDGSVQSCALFPGQSVSVTKDGADLKAAFSAQLVRASSAAGSPVYSGKVTLVYEQNDWRIETIDATLLGSDVAPLVVAQTLCDGLVHENYGEAYDTLSVNQKNQVGQRTTDEFTGDFYVPFHVPGQGVVEFTSCQPQVDNYQQPISGSTPSVTLALQAEQLDAQGRVTQQATFQMTITLKLDTDGWRVDGLTSLVRVS